MNKVWSSIVVFLVIAAVVQWLGVGERVYHALWQWYKFKDYSGNGHTTISYTMAIFTFVVSVLLIIIGYFTRQKTSNHIIKKMAGASMVSLLAGLVSFSVLLISPISTLVVR